MIIYSMDFGRFEMKRLWSFGDPSDDFQGDLPVYIWT